MDISRYLAAFIKQHPEVIVPGLGTFYRVQEPARYDAASQTFLPPSEGIGFSDAFTDDRKLIEYISTTENIDSNSAAYFLEQYVSNLNDLLANTEQIKIDALGTFSKTKEGYTFEAIDALKPDSAYGLKPQREAGIANAAPEATTAPVIAEEEQEEEEEQPKGNSGKKFFLILLIALLAAFAGMQFYYPQWLSSFQYLLKQHTVDTVAKAEPALPVAADTTTTDSSLTKTPDSLSKSSRSIQAESFEIVVAAFGKREEAEAYSKQLNQRGFKAHILEPKPGEYFKVSAGSFTDEKTAQIELKRIQTDLSASAWLYHVKPVKLN